MHADLLSYMLSVKDIKARLQLLLAIQCAPLLKGLKASALLPMNAGAREDIGFVLQGTGIEHLFLGGKQERPLLFLYRPEELRSLLQKKESRGFLDRNGYGGKGLGSSLRLLSYKMSQYSKGACCFPHEIGVFLGYPVKDVESFIMQKGKGCLFSGYWKVYHDPLQAQLTFHAYDQARVSAVNELLSGRPLKEIVENVKLSGEKGKYSW